MSFSISAWSPTLPYILSLLLLLLLFFPTSILSFNIKIQTRTSVLSSMYPKHICNYPESTFFLSPLYFSSHGFSLLISNFRPQHLLVLSTM